MTDSRNPNRREFLAVSAIGLMTLGRVPDGDLLYVGTYTEGGRTEGIHLLRMDRRTGELRKVDSIDAGPNPSFLAVHPNKRFLYAVNELEEYNGKPTGAVSAFAIDRNTGGLTRLNEQASEGGSPCYVSVDRGGQFVFVANYVGGSIAAFPIEASGSLGKVSSVIQHTGKGPNAERQKTPHAHSILSDPSNRFVLSADLGVDRVFLYRFDAKTKSLRHVDGGDAVMRSGAGPRHIAFHPTLPLAFVANELDSTIVTLRFDTERGALSPVATYSTVPKGWSGANYPADIHVAANGRTVYVSNRGHNSIAVFSVTKSTGALGLDQVISTEGDWPRNFSLDPSGRWLLVANQRSGTIIVFERDQKNGRLKLTPQRIEIPSPVCLRF